MKKKTPKKACKKKTITRLSESISHDDIYTIHPPGFWTIDDLSKLPAYSTKRDFITSHTEDCIALDITLEEFKKTQNPIMIIKAFMIAHNIGFYPPMWALNEMMKIFIKYVDSQGKEDLNKLFGGIIGSGGNSYFVKQLKEFRDFCYKDVIFRLHSLGIPIVKAIHMAAEHSVNKKICENSKLKPLTDKGIKKKWDTEWSKSEEWKEWREDKGNMALVKAYHQTHNADKQNLKQFLEEFPEHTLPHEIKLLKKML